MFSTNTIAFCILLTVFSLNKVNALNNGLALTPPMGWLHWQRFRCNVDCQKYPDDCISEKLFKRTANLLVSEGYADLGYEYVIIDDCWMENKRDSKTQKLVPDRRRFPSGLKALADYIHGKGLQFGLYGTYGLKTCAGYPGSINHLEIDAQSFAEWEVDYVKFDGCFTDPFRLDQGYIKFGMLLNKTQRPIVYSCSWPFYQESNSIEPKYNLIKKYCNLWRNGEDIGDYYRSLANIMNYFGDNQFRFQKHAGPGHWNDPDVLLLGNFGLSYEESKTQMAVWAILAAPLIMSNDLATVNAEIKSILQNREIIKVNQDPLGIQGKRVVKEEVYCIWTRPITPINKRGQFSYAVAFVNNQNSPTMADVTLEKMGLKNKFGYRVIDLFDGKGLGQVVVKDSFQAAMNPNGVAFFKFTALDD